MIEVEILLLALLIQFAGAFLLVRALLAQLRSANNALISRNTQEFVTLERPSAQAKRHVPERVEDFLDGPVRPMGL